MTPPDPLIPCPGCGDQPTHHSGLKHNYTPYDDGAFWYQFACKCGWCGPLADSRGEASRLWDLRTLQTSTVPVVADGVLVPMALLTRLRNYALRVHEWTAPSPQRMGVIADVARANRILRGAHDPRR